MNLLVLLAGVADPKWPLPAEVSAAALDAHRARHPLLSPFDEAALELALRLRDDGVATRIDALVGSAGGTGEPLVRHVAGYRLDEVAALDLVRHPAWNAVPLAASLAAWIGGRPAELAPALVLVGREFGDTDDGVLPAVLAETLGWPLVSQTLLLSARGPGRFEALRQPEGALERVAFEGPALVAATNHKGNRLRHPLLKNVMAAKRLALAMAELPPAPGDVHALRCTGLAPAARAARERKVRLLAGTPEEQAVELARFLLAEAGLVA